MLRVWCGAALALTALFATANMALSREWETGEMNSEWQVVFTTYVVNIGPVSHTMNLDRSDIQPLMFRGNQVFDARCSPDGSTLYFFSGNSNYAASADGTEIRAHRVNNAFRPALSPDGNKIAFQADTGDIYVSNPDGISLTQLVRRAAQPAWSPDGSMIAYVSSRNGRFNIHVIDVHRLISVQLTHVTTHLNRNYFPTWTPDGNQIMYLVAPISESYGGDLHIMNTDGGKQRLLTDPPSRVFTACILRARPVTLIAGS